MADPNNPGESRDKSPPSVSDTVMEFESPMAIVNRIPGLNLLNPESCNLEQKGADLDGTTTTVDVGTKELEVPQDQPMEVQDTADKDLDGAIGEVKTTENATIPNPSSQMQVTDSTEISKTDTDKVEEINESPAISNTDGGSHKTPFLDAIDRALHSNPIQYSSDEEDSTQNGEMSPTGRAADTSSSSESDASSGSESENVPGSDSEDSSSSSSDESDSDANDGERGGEVTSARKRANDDDLDMSDEDSGGPVRSRHEVLDEPAPQLPEDLKITEQTQLEYVGNIIRVAGKNIIISAAVSGEFRVLEEKSVFCMEDRTPIGVLYETFGRVQAPLYSVKFDSTEAAEQYKNRIGEKVYYVVSASKFLFTDSIKNMKGSDASNLHDEEIPEEEQEYSDDEKERLNNSKKKKKKSRVNDDQQGENRQQPNNANKIKNPSNKTKFRKNQHGIEHNRGGPQARSHQGPSYSSSSSSSQGHMPYQGQPFTSQQYFNPNSNPNFMGDNIVNYNTQQYPNFGQNLQYNNQFSHQQQPQRWNPMQPMMPPVAQQQLQQQFQMMQQYMNNNQQGYISQSQHLPHQQQQYQFQAGQQQQQQQQQQHSLQQQKQQQQQQQDPNLYSGSSSASRGDPRSYDSQALNYDDAK